VHSFEECLPRQHRIVNILLGNAPSLDEIGVSYAHVEETGEVVILESRECWSIRVFDSQEHSLGFLDAIL
jgi:hypothetical protein